MPQPAELLHDLTVVPALDPVRLLRIDGIHQRDQGIFTRFGKIFPVHDSQIPRQPFSVEFAVFDLEILFPPVRDQPARRIVRIEGIKFRGFPDEHRAVRRSVVQRIGFFEFHVSLMIRIQLSLFQGTVDSVRMADIVIRFGDPDIFMVDIGTFFPASARGGTQRHFRQPFLILVITGIEDRRPAGFFPAGVVKVLLERFIRDRVQDHARMRRQRKTPLPDHAPESFGQNRLPVLVGDVSRGHPVFPDREISIHGEQQSLLIREIHLHIQRHDAVTAEYGVPAAHIPFPVFLHLPVFVQYSEPVIHQVVSGKCPAEYITVFSHREDPFPVQQKTVFPKFECAESKPFLPKDFSGWILDGQMIKIPVCRTPQLRSFQDKRKSLLGFPRRDRFRFDRKRLRCPVPMITETVPRFELKGQPRPLFALRVHKENPEPDFPRPVIGGRKYLFRIQIFFAFQIDGLPDPAVSAGGKNFDCQDIGTVFQIRGDIAEETVLRMSRTDPEMSRRYIFTYTAALLATPRKCRSFWPVFHFSGSWKLRRYQPSWMMKFFDGT